jgi:hypothetical protein
LPDDVATSIVGPGVTYPVRRAVALGGGSGAGHASATGLPPTIRVWVSPGDGPVRAGTGLLKRYGAPGTTLVTWASARAVGANAGHQQQLAETLRTVLSGGGKIGVRAICNGFCAFVFTCRNSSRQSVQTSQYFLYQSLKAELIGSAGSPQASVCPTPTTTIHDSEYNGEELKAR